MRETKTTKQTQKHTHKHKTVDMKNKSLCLKSYSGHYCHSSIQPSIDIHPSSIQTSIFIHPTIHCHPFIHPFSTQVFFALVVFVLCGVLHLQLQSFTFFFFSCFSCVSGGKEEREREREREREEYLRRVQVFEGCCGQESPLSPFLCLSAPAVASVIESTNCSYKFII